MREIVHIQLGDCGNTIGSEFWKCLCDDHGLDGNLQYVGDSDYQLERIDAFFNEALGGRYTPRAIFADLEQAVIDKYRKSQYFSYMEPDNFLSDNQLSHGNYANKYDYYDFKDHIMDIVRKEAENSDSLQGFQLLHATSGAAGSGLTSNLLENIKDEYSDRIIKTSSIIPFSEAMNLLTEPYDTIFMLQNLIYNCEVTSVFDNEDIYNFCQKRMRDWKPKWFDLNNMIIQMIYGESLSFRFPNDMCSDLRKFAVNLVSYQNLHFLSHALCPLFPRGACFCYFNIQSMEKLTTNLFDRVYHPFDPNPNSEFGPIISAILTYLGKVDPVEAEIEFSKLKAEKSNYFLKQIPDNVKYWVCNTRSFMVRSGYFTYNSALMGNKFKKAIDKFDELYQRKAWINNYLVSGMDELEFVEAREDVMKLSSEYQQLLNKSNSNE